LTRKYFPLANFSNGKQIQKNFKNNLKKTTFHQINNTTSLTSYSITTRGGNLWTEKNRKKGRSIQSPTLEISLQVKVLGWKQLNQPKPCV